MKYLPALALCLVIFPSTALASVERRYDEFTDKTTVWVAPNLNNWDGTPKLFLNTTFQGKAPTKKPSLLFFSVIVPIRQYAQCASGVDGVIADGKRIPSGDENSPVLAEFPKVNPLGRTNPMMKPYLELYERFKPEDFRAIAYASTVIYQLCGNEKEVYTLSGDELRSLRSYYDAVYPFP